MNATTFELELAYAEAQRDRARSLYEGPGRPGDRRRAAEDLNYWQGRVAFLRAAVERERAPQ